MWRRWVARMVSSVESLVLLGCSCVSRERAARMWCGWAIQGSAGAASTPGEREGERERATSVRACALAALRCAALRCRQTERERERGGRSAVQGEVRSSAVRCCEFLAASAVASILGSSGALTEKSGPEPEPRAAKIVRGVVVAAVRWNSRPRGRVRLGWGAQAGVQRWFAVSSHGRSSTLKVTRRPRADRQRSSTRISALLACFS